MFERPKHLIAAILAPRFELLRAVCPALLDDDRRVVRGRLDLVQRLTLPVGNLSQAPGQPAKPDLSKLVIRRAAGVQFGRGGGNGP